MLWLAGMAGCADAPKEERQIWQNIKIGDLAPTVREKDREKARFFATVQMEIRVLELPGENVDQLDDLWRQLSPKGVFMSSYNAFTNNSFRVKSGRIEAWEKTQQALAEAGAQRTATLSLAIPDNDTSDLPIADLAGGPHDRVRGQQSGEPDRERRAGLARAAAAGGANPLGPRRAQDHCISYLYPADLGGHPPVAPDGPQK